MTTQTQPTNDKTFLHQYIAGAFLPLLQSIITGMIVFVAVYVIALIVFNALDPHKPALVVSVGYLFYTWMNRQKMWMSLAQWEQLTGIDINNDGVIGDQVQAEAEPQVSTVWIDLRKVNDGGSYSNSKFPLPKGVTEAHLSQMARDMFIMGKSFAEAELSGPGKISLPKFRQLRNIMEKQSLCEKIGTASNASIELTDAGEAWLREYLPSPTPPETDV